MEQDLVHGLPDELALNCLIRLPSDNFPTIRAVCTRWREVVGSPHFHSLRRSCRLVRPLVVLTQAESLVDTGGSAKKYSASAPSYRLTLHEPDTGAWGDLPRIPGLRHGLPLFCRIAAAGRAMVVIGGWDPETWTPTNAVHVYDFVTGTWRRGADMPGPRRSFFACAAAAGEQEVVLVAGGHDEDKNALRSALAYDLARNNWATLPDMASERDECQGVISRGKFHVIGGYPTESQGRFSRSVEAFDLATWTWGPVEDAEVEATAPPRACVAGDDGAMYACSGGHLAVKEGATWRPAVDLPADVRVAPQVVGWEGSVMVMGSGTHGGAQSVYVVKMAGKGLTWRKVEVPPEYSGHIQAVCCVEI